MNNSVVLCKCSISEVNRLKLSAFSEVNLNKVAEDAFVAAQGDYQFGTEKSAMREWLDD
jgi:hypothetical protein